MKQVVSTMVEGLTKAFNWVFYPTSFSFEDTNQVYHTTAVINGVPHAVECREFKYVFNYRFFGSIRSDRYLYHVNTLSPGKNTHGIYPSVGIKLYRGSMRVHRMVVDVHLKSHRDISRGG